MRHSSCSSFIWRCTPESLQKITSGWCLCHVSSALNLKPAWHAWDILGQTTSGPLEAAPAFPNTGRLPFRFCGSADKSRGNSATLNWWMQEQAWLRWWCIPPNFASLRKSSDNWRCSVPWWFAWNSHDSWLKAQFHWASSCEVPRSCSGPGPRTSTWLSASARSRTCAKFCPKTV